MKERLLITTAIGLMLGTGAFAQSPSDQQKNNPPPAAQSQTNQNSSAPASSSTSSQSSTPSAQNAPSTSSDKSSTTTSQSTPNTTDTSSQAQSNQTSAPSQGQSTNNAATAPSNNAGAAPSQAQSTQQPNAPSQAQTNTPPPANNQTQASPTGSNTNTNAGSQPSTNTAAQPSDTQPNTANVSVSASLNETQRTRVTESITRLNVAPINNVNFSLSVGTVVPRDVRFQPLPADVVEILPQYRGYNFFVVHDDIVIVEPSTYKIVDVLLRTGRSTAAAPAPAPSSHKVTFSDKDREIIRKHARSSRTEQRTTGSSTTTTRVRVGERLPESVEIRAFPETVYRESPSLRDYRYIERDNRTYVIEPRERTIIDEID